MKVFINNTNKMENFDITRHVMLDVDEETKTVIAYILTPAEEFMEKLHKTIRALGRQYSGYTVLATLPLADGNRIIVTARIH